VGILYKNELLGEIAFFNDTVEENKKIKGDTNYIETVINKTWGEIKRAKNSGKFYLEEEEGNEEEKEEIYYEDIRYEDGMKFSEYLKKNIKDNKISRIAEGLVKGNTYEKIDKENIDISYSFIDKHASLMRNHRHEKYKLDDMFEDWYALSLGAPKEFLHEIVAHNEHIPDIIWDSKIHSLKLRFSREASLTFYQSKENASNSLRPEYKEAIKNKCEYFFVFFNPTWNQNILIKEINPFKDGDKIVCKPNRIILLNY